MWNWRCWINFCGIGSNYSQIKQWKEKSNTKSLSESFSEKWQFELFRSSLSHLHQNWTWISSIRTWKKVFWCLTVQKLGLFFFGWVSHLISTLSDSPTSTNFVNMFDRCLMWEKFVIFLCKKISPIRSFRGTFPPPLFQCRLWFMFVCH